MVHNSEYIRHVMHLKAMIIILQLYYHAIEMKIPYSRKKIFKYNQASTTSYHNNLMENCYASLYGCIASANNNFDYKIL